MKKLTQYVESCFFYTSYIGITADMQLKLLYWLNIRQAPVINFLYCMSLHKLFTEDFTFF